jgi:hypothetical protein
VLADTIITCSATTSQQDSCGRPWICAGRQLESAQRADASASSHLHTSCLDTHWRTGKHPHSTWPTCVCTSLVLCRLESAQGAEQDLVLLQQAAEVAELQQEAVRVARELDAQQLLALLQQQQLAAQQEQVRTRPQGTPGQVQGLRQHACSRLACAGTCGHAAVCWTPTST